MIKIIYLVDILLFLGNDCFLFTLTNIYNTEPTKFPYSQYRSVYHGTDYGPYLGNSDLRLHATFNDNSNYSNFPSSYQDIIGKGKSIFTGDINNNNQYFKLKEVEIFKLS